MARVNITLPDELIARARAEGLNVSKAAAAGIADELRRREKVSSLEDYLDEWEAESGPASEQETREAEEWSDRVLAAHERVSGARANDRAA